MQCCIPHFIFTDIYLLSLTLCAIKLIKVGTKRTKLQASAYLVTSFDVASQAYWNMMTFISDIRTFTFSASLFPETNADIAEYVK